MNLKQLSQHLNLSQTTVSRALNGYPEVSEATRLRVQKAAQDLNYRPNTRAKGLATGRSHAIGHVIPVSNQHEMVNPVFGDFIAGAGEVYTREGYDMVLSLVADRDETRAYQDIKSRGMVDGIIVHGPVTKDTRIALLSHIGLPFVVHGRSTDVNLPYSWVDVNNRGAFQRGTQFLIELGHRRIALLNGLEHMDFAFRRRSGYENALAAHGLPVDPDLMRSEEMTEIYGYRATKAMLAQEAAPTAIMCSSIITAIGARRAVHEAGLALARDVSIITFDDELSYLENGDDVAIFTALRSSVRSAGRQAADMLLSLISLPQSAPKTRLLEAELIIGRSTGPAPA
ncbi:LacI family DNA-binding transcriptional regulator [Marivita sp. S2033]|uniref:LacI family DNA-binding transcriptional regulator n=1 Tax=Marivita sp. S2033 TaxID=3373187 RepID=UPI0039822FCA